MSPRLAPRSTGHAFTVPSPLQRPAPWAQRKPWHLEGLTAKAYRATRGIQLIQQSRAEPAAAADSLRSAALAAEPQPVGRQAEEMSGAALAAMSRRPLVLWP